MGAPWIGGRIVAEAGITRIQVRVHDRVPNVLFVGALDNAIPALENVALALMRALHSERGSATNRLHELSERSDALADDEV